MSCEPDQVDSKVGSYVNIMAFQILHQTLLSELWAFFSIMASSKDDSSCSDVAILLFVAKRPRGSPQRIKMAAAKRSTSFGRSGGPSKAKKRKG